MKVTVTAPGIYNPFSQSAGPGIVTVYTAEVEATPAEIAALLPSVSVTAPAAPVHLTAAELRAQYPDAELFAGIESPKTA
jgi:hypothetical protein